MKIISRYRHILLISCPSFNAALAVLIKAIGYKKHLVGIIGISQLISRNEIWFSLTKVCDDLPGDYTLAVVSSPLASNIWCVHLMTCYGYI